MADSPETTEEFLAEIAKVIPDVEHQSHVYKLVDNFLKQNIDGLKLKNSELISENKKLKDKAALPDGLDSESIKIMLEELKGKSLEDYGNSIREEVSGKLTELQGKLSESETRAGELDMQYQSTLINLEIRAAAERAHIRPEAIDDFVALHSKNFELKDGQAVVGELSSSDYVGGILESSPYWLPHSRGAGAGGARAGGGGMSSDRALAAAAASGNQAEYRRLRGKQRDGGGK